ncbi:MAG: LamG domain-containing protein [Bacteroidales bacterium]|jgi:hypothetical protein|nr:LamG domain-containing protein [Bacteroidales bacterium]
MANENNLILNMPFDEPNGSLIAYDYSQSRADGEVVQSNFVSGRQGNCIEFTGEGYCEIPQNLINLSGSFSLLAWLKSKHFPDGFTGKKIGFFVRWEAMDGYRETWVSLPTDSWGYFAVVKNGLNIYIYLDTQLIQTITLPAQPTGFAFLQDIYSTENGYGYVDEIKVYNIALTQEQIAELLNSVSQLSYSLEGIDFKQWDIYVSESNGILDRPKLKSPLRVDWDDYHGEVIDLQKKRVEAREITLNCFMKANGKMDFVNKLNDFLDIFSKDGTQRLTIDIHPTKPLVYEIYNESGVSISKRWHDELMVGTFSLKLKEPNPVKRVIRHQRISEATKKLTITVTSNRALTIFWGDGTKNEDVYGENVTVNHEYTSEGIYYAIVAGVIEDITNFSTNGIVVWQKI